MTLRIPVLALALLPGIATAQTAYSIDSEFLRPTFGSDSFLGVDVAQTRKPFAVRMGTVLMYTRDPVTLWDRLADEELGAVVTDRGTFMLGASIDISERFSMNALLPIGINSPGEAGDPKEFEAPGVGMSDIGVGARLTAYESKNEVFALGARAGLIFPSGRREAYLGDKGFRPHLGLLASLDIDRTLIGTDVGVMFRPDTEETKEDFIASSELQFNVGLRHKLPDATRVGFTAQALSRLGFSNFLGGGGENSLEAMGGIQIYPAKTVTLDVAAGRGLTEGFGSTDLRVLGGLTIEFVPKEPIVLPPPPPPPPMDPPPIEAIIDPIVETDFVRVTETNIEIKQRIEFVVGTTTLLDGSRPVLDAIAEVFHTQGRIIHVDIEGHASVEGSYEYNYNLSQGRARTIWQELVNRGVHPERIAYRGMGEVIPRKAGSSEAELQDNRRVEFHITKLISATDEWPDFMTETVVKAPWTGNPVKIITPPKPEAPGEEGVDGGDPFDFDEDGDDGFDPDAIPNPDENPVEEQPETPEDTGTENPTPEDGEE